MDKRALIIGGTGIVGRNLAEHLLWRGDWAIAALSRGRTTAPAGVESITADLTSANIGGRRTDGAAVQPCLLHCMVAPGDRS